MKAFRLWLGALFLISGALGFAGCGDDDSANASQSDAATGNSGNGGIGGKAGSGGKSGSKSRDAGGGNAGGGSDAGKPNPGAPVKFRVPKNGGTATVLTLTGHKIGFTFPKSVAGMDITLTPTTATAIGWSDDAFKDLIRMEPDGLQFAEPVIVKPETKDVLLETFANSKRKSAGEMLKLSKTADGLELNHFSILAVIAAQFSCGNTTGWVASANSRRCANETGAPTSLDFSCDANPYCWHVTAHCCAAAGATECLFGDPQLALSFTYQGDVSGQFPWCAVATTVHDAGMDAGHDAGQDASQADEDAGGGGSGGQQGGSGGQQGGGSGGQQGGTGGQQGGTGGQQGGTGGAGDDAGLGSGGIGGGTGGIGGGTGGIGGGTGGAGDDAGVGSGGIGGGTGGIGGGTGGQQGTGGTQGGSGGSGGSNCKNPAFVDCGNGCVDLTNDINNCGACNNPCSTACIDSVCATATLDSSCPPGRPFHVVGSSAPLYYDAFALYDMNNDQQLDVVGGTLYEVDVNPGAGDGTFGAAVPTGGNEAYRLAVGDFDHDGHGDVANWALKFEYGEATFGTFTEFAYTPPLWPGQLQNTVSAPIAAADFNDDGRIDIAEFTSGNTGVSELFVLNNRNFDTSSTVAIGGIASAIATGDFSGDGVDDVAVVVPNTSLVILPSPLNANTVITLPADNAASSLAFGKFDADAKADIVIAHQNQKEVGVVLGASPTGTSIIPIPIFANQVVTGDFTHDGRIDIVALGNAALVILPGDGQGSFGAALGPYAIDSTPYNEAHTGDVNGDQSVDIVRKIYSGGAGTPLQSLIACPALP